MSDAARIRLEPSWKARIGDYLLRPEMQALAAFLRAEKQAGKRIYPPGPEIFAAFEHTPFDAVRVVILGQDPYHGPGQAHGLCFSVRPGVRVPPSLENIFKEIQREPGIPRPDHGCLTPWAERGVLLLNRALTVEPGKPNSHQGKGWEEVTEQAIVALTKRDTPLVAILWGRDARNLAPLLGSVPRIESAHPSPMSAHNGFFGTRPFSRANELLQRQGADPVDWRLP